MFIGPVFHREAVIAPRRPRTYAVRAIYAAALLTLMSTAWLMLTGTQRVRDVGDFARFGATLFQILAPLQLALAAFSAAVLAAGAVAQEKDRRTLELLLLSNLSNCELVLGKLLASLLSVLALLAAGLPVFMLLMLLGGVSLGQIGRVFAATLAGVLACGSLGSTLALWREKTFQALAATVLVLVLWLALGEIVAAGAMGEAWCGLSSHACAVAISPWQAVLEASRPLASSEPALGGNSPVALFLAVSAAMIVLLNAVAVLQVRVWNPTREWQPAPEDAPEPTEETSAGLSSARAAGRTRPVWDNPVVWREMRTWAYGRKVLIIRLAYLVLFALAAVGLHWMTAAGRVGGDTGAAAALAGLLLLSLVLVNAQAVTSITSERDGRALDLLLVTDLSPKEIVFGKLGGVLYNTKEMVLLPMFLCAYLYAAGAVGLENLVYLLGGLAAMYAFVATLGIHAGMTYANSRTAIGTSLATVFFLSLGVATCMRMLIAFSAFHGAFQVQLLPFSALVLGGGAGLYAALGARNPSTAIGLASFFCPLGTFYAATSYLLGSTLGVFLVVVVVYGFTTAAMLVPAIYEFDVATGRTTADEG